MREPITTDGAPAAVGPYVHAVKAAGLVFVSGQIPLDPDSGELVGETAAEQAEQVRKNLTASGEAAGATLADAVKCTVYLPDMDDFQAVNEVYARHFTDTLPARVAYGVVALPRGAKVEIDAIVAV